MTTDEFGPGPVAHGHLRSKEHDSVVAADSQVALTIDSLSLVLRRQGALRPLLSEVSLTVRSGETVGLVGESGSGKSLTSRAALGLFPSRSQVTGSVRVGGREIVGASRRAITEVRRNSAAMVFQDPRAAINPVRRLGDFLTEGARSAGAEKSAATSRAIALLAEVGISEPSRAMDAYPHEFSGGMLQRVMIAAALMTSPGLLLADEATTALDVTTQAEVLSLLQRVQTSHSTGTLLVTHDLELAAATCDRIYVMYAGRVVESASSWALFENPRHPYTMALLASSPSVRGQKREIRPIAGRPLALADAPAGCSFRDRCPKAASVCATAVPPSEIVNERIAACYFPGESE